MLSIGLDLGWQSGPSGVCCLVFQDDEWTVQSLDRLATLEDVLRWLDEVAPDNTPAIIGVDAPLVIPNETGMRSPDRLAHKYFGKYHAGCYPANRNSPFADRLTAFSHALEARGFQHAPCIHPQRAGRYQAEVFPHPASIQLFGLSKILKYKKGRIAERAQALGQLRQLILTQLPQHEPPLVISSLPAVPSGGKALKALEDRLDSILCAYVAAYWWYWGTQRNAVLGDGACGYIVVPCPAGAPVALSQFSSLQYSDSDK
ncbi:MAG: DUF429 domain-containing protein [Cyanobacteria bacterium J06632_3]